MTINIHQLAELEMLAQQCTQSIAACLQPGMSEETAASLMRQWLHEHGLESTLHRPLAWFGERTASAMLPQKNSLAHLRPNYFPTQTKLQEGQPFVLYCALRSGDQVEVAESFHCNSLDTHHGYQQLCLKLSHLKTLVMRAINEQQTLRELNELVAHLAQTQGVNLQQQAISDDWVRPYSDQPNMGQTHRGLVHKVVSFTGNNAPAHLPSAAIEQAFDEPLGAGIWVVQPWILSGNLGAGSRDLLYIDEQGQASWLTDIHQQTQAA